MAITKVMSTTMIGSHAFSLIATILIAHVGLHHSALVSAATLGDRNINSKNDEIYIHNSMNPANIADLVEYNNGLKLSDLNNVLASSRAELRSIFPTRQDFMRFILTHKQALLEALMQQQQQQDEVVENNNFVSSNQPEQFYDPMNAAAASYNLEQKRAQPAAATYLRFGRTARLRFGKRALPYNADNDVLLGQTIHAAARRAARLRFG